MLTVPSRRCSMASVDVVFSAGMKIAFSLQPMYTELVDNQSIPSTTSIFLRGRQMRSITNLRPLKVIEHSLQISRVSTTSSVADEIIIGLGRGLVSKPSLRTQG